MLLWFTSLLYFIFYLLAPLVHVVNKPIYIYIYIYIYRKIFEREIFRNIYVPKYENGEMEKSDEWRTRRDELLVGCAEVCFLTHFMVQSPS